MYKHKFLVATNLITDPVFAQSVVFLFRHNHKGADGVIVNAEEIGQVGLGSMDLLAQLPPTFNQVKDMMQQGKLKSVPLYQGGPCRTPGIYFLHGYADLLDLPDEKPEYDLGIPASFDADKSKHQMYVMDGLYFGTPVHFIHLVENGRMGENKFRFFSGSAGWGPGQLEEEIKGGAWTVHDATPELFFDRDALNKLSGKGQSFLDRFCKPSLN